MVIDIAVPSGRIIKKEEYGKLEKYQGLKEELWRMWKVKASVVPMMVGAYSPKLKENLQQISEKASVQKSAVRTAKIVCRKLQRVFLCVNWLNPFPIFWVVFSRPLLTRLSVPESSQLCCYLLLWNVPQQRG